MNASSRLADVAPTDYPNSENFFLHYGDMSDLHALCALVRYLPLPSSCSGVLFSFSIVALHRDTRPTEVYNLAAQSHVYGPPYTLVTTASSL